MIIEPLPDAPSSVLPEHRRISCRLSYELAGAEPETVWFEVPAEFAEGSDERGDAWLICFLLLAASLQERLVIRGTVDPSLARNAAELLRIWSKWHPDLAVVEVETSPRTEGKREACPSPERPAGRVGCFFSGGVDSFFTILHHGTVVLRHQEAGERPISDLILVWGFDLPLAKGEEFRKLSASLKLASAQLGLPLHQVATNLRETGFGRLGWGSHTHGSGLGTVAHLLGARLPTVLISSSFDYGTAVSWGSHPLTDPLMSSANTRILHYGAGFDRFEKTEFVSANEIALQHLHVCWRAELGTNCGNCLKCYLTMLALETLGRLGRSAAFPARQLSMEKARRIVLDNYGAKTLYAQLARHARSRNRPEVAEAITESERWNRKRERVEGLVDRCQRFTLPQPALAAMRAWFYRGAIE